MEDSRALTHDGVADAVFDGLLVAHRGHRAGGPENTVEGMAQLDAWVDGVEVDVRLSADGVPVLMHDPTVDRTTDGSGAVADLPLSAIGRLDAGDGARVPTLAAYLEECRRRQWRLVLVDIKVEGQAAFEAVADIVGSSGVAGDCVVMVRPGPGAAQLRRIAPDLRIGCLGLTSGNAPALIGATREVGGELLLTAFDAYLEHRRAIRAVHGAGLLAGSSTNNELRSLSAAKQDGCDVILTDRTAELGAF